MFKTGLSPKEIKDWNLDFFSFTLGKVIWLFITINVNLNKNNRNLNKSNRTEKVILVCNLCFDDLFDLFCSFSGRKKEY